VGRREDHSRQLWGLMSFSLWAEQMDRPETATEPVARVSPVGGAK
jgi:hypothetical protein